MDYKEKYETGNKFRQEYLESIENLIQKKREEAKNKRTEFDKKLVQNIEWYREQFIQQLGWPLNEYFANGSRNKPIPAVKKIFLVKDNETCIYRLQIEVFKDFWYYGILFLKDDGKKRPLVISQHGGHGTPELCSSFFEDGTYNYNEMTERILKYDVNVFAPQMLLWNKEIYPIQYDRKLIDNMLKRCGGSITALELMCLMTSLDYLETECYVDEERMGMVGLSYGGMYALYMSAVDTRLKSTISCSYFDDRFTETRSDWIYFNSANTFSDSEAAMLVYPRKLYLAMGDEDTVFSAEGSRREFKRIEEAYADDLGWVSLTIFHGEHEFIQENDLLDSLIVDLNNK